MPFQKGRSGNPGGRPKETHEVKDLARKHTKEALERLLFWMRSDNAKASVTAAQTLLDRGYGKATQPVESDVTHHYVIEAPIPADNPQEWASQHAPPTT